MAKSSAAPNREILEAALQGLEGQRQKLEEQIAQVRAMIGGRSGRTPRGTSRTATGSSGNTGTARKKRILSPEARKRIAAAQKKRWAAFRKSNQ